MEKSAKKVWSSLLEYMHIFVSKENSTNALRERRSMTRVNESYDKLYKLNSSCHRDAEWWSTAKVPESCPKNARGCEKTPETYKGIDNLLNSKGAKPFYQKSS